jgi:hypothetical protein
MPPGTDQSLATVLRDLEALYAEEDAANNAALAACGQPKSQYLSPGTFVKVGCDLRRRQ